MINTDAFFSITVYSNFRQKKPAANYIKSLANAENFNDFLLSLTHF